MRQWKQKSSLLCAIGPQDSETFCGIENHTSPLESIKGDIVKNRWGFSKTGGAITPNVTPKSEDTFELP